MQSYTFLEKTDLKNFIEKLSRAYDIYIPVKKGEQRFYRKYTGSTDDIVIGEVRPFEPLKAFFTPAREKVAEDFNAGVPKPAGRPLAIVGVKACDLKGFKVQDHVFKDQDCPDPFYTKNREQNLIISADCTCAIETCFCLALGLHPHPGGDFDINLSETNRGFVVETGSPRGEELVDQYPSLFKKASQEPIRQRDEQRARVIREVEENIKKYEIPHEDAFNGMVERNYDSKMWSDEAKTCVECGACNTICPTCHCFLLADQRDERHLARFRLWDSCMIKDFARVAGGANPRPQLWMRLRNRFEKKFDFFPKVADIYACTGCGRCISACPAKIDIREVLKRLVNNA